MSSQRATSYGETRRFRGLERMAIQRRQRAAHQALAELAANQPSTLQVLELGCGFSGQNLLLLSESFPEVHFTGVDVAVAQTQPAPTVRLEQVDVESWQPSAPYDLVLSLAVVEHLLEPGRHFALLADCLAPKGMALLTTPTPQADAALRLLGRLGIFDREEIMDHKNYLTERGIRRMAAQASLVVVDYRLLSMGMNQSVTMHKGKA